MALSCSAILFDLDGVLVDSDAAIRRRWQRWAEERGIPFEDIEAIYTGRPMVEVIQEVAPHLDPKAETERLGDMMATDTGDLTAFEGAEALLAGLPEGQWTIATSGRRRTATSRLAHVGLPVPDTLVTADDVEEGKPSPEPYLLAAQNLGVEPSRCVVVEDAPAGVEAARRAGAAVLALPTSQAPEALSAASAVVSRLKDLRVRSTNGTLLVEWGDEVEVRSND